MKNCETCANAIFDEVWGEYKCIVLGHVIDDLDEIVDCSAHKKGKPKISEMEWEGK